MIHTFPDIFHVSFFKKAPYFHPEPVHEHSEQFHYKLPNFTIKKIPETIQMFFNEAMVKQTVVHIYHEILLSNKMA